MVDFLEIVASEAAKVAATAVMGRLDTGAQRLLRVLRSKSRSLPDDPAEVRRAVPALAREDIDWGNDLVRAVSDLHPDGVVVGAPEGIRWFRNRVRHLESVPADGVRVIAGAGGSGRTELARQLADRVHDDFPSGRLELDFRDYRVGDETDVAAVKRAVLLRFGIAGGEIAVDDDRLDQQFMSAMVTRRCVVIADNVIGGREVELFSRFRANVTLATTAVLTRDLRALDPHAIQLRGLDADGAAEMLADYSGEVSPPAEPAATRELVATCGGMPFALREAGLTLAARAGERTPVAGLVREYRAAGVVDAETVIADALRRTFDVLPPDAVWACALLAEFPGGWFTREAATVYLSEDAARGAAAFDAVVAAQLTEQVWGGYRLTRLVREYSATLLGDRDSAFDRLLRYMRDNAVAADLAGDDPASRRTRLREYVVPQGLSWTRDRDRFEWLDEHFGLIGALVSAACQRRRYKETCQLAGAVEVLVNQHGRWREYAELSEWAVQAARAQHEQATGRGRAGLLARTLAMRAKAHYLVRWFERAEADLRQAHRLAETAAGPAWRAQRLRSSIAEFWGRYREEHADVLAGSGGVAGDELAEAIHWFRQAVAIDEEIRDDTALGIHLRMLAGALLKAQQVPEAMAAASDALQYTAGRNYARVLMVFVKAHLALGETARARTTLTEAQESLARVGADQYRWELREVEARLLMAEGDRGRAREAWAALVDDAVAVGHPRADEYLNELGTLPQQSGLLGRFFR